MRCVYGALMRSVWFALIGPTIVEVEQVLLKTYHKGVVYDFHGPLDAAVLYIRVSEYAWSDKQKWESDDYAELLVATNGERPTVEVFADVSGRVPGDTEVKALAELLLGAFGGFAFDDFLAYQHAWSLAEIREDHLVDGMHFFDYNESFARYKASQA
jgi:hypothetical protein